jgi:tRNA splicing endonuclease
MKIANKEMFDKYKYILMLDMDLDELEELEKLYPNDDVIKKYKQEIIRLNNDEDFIREPREEEEREKSVEN